MFFCVILCGHPKITFIHPVINAQWQAKLDYLFFDYLIQTDKDVDSKQISKSGNCLLHAAVNTGDPSIVRLLLQAGADVNQMNMECDCVVPLHLAIMQGKL